MIYLQNNRFVESVDFEDNDLGPEGAICVTQMLRESEHIQEVVRTRACV